MPLLRTIVDAYVVATQPDNATQSRLMFWVERLGDVELTEITTDDVDDAMAALVQRGCSGSSCAVRSTVTLIEETKPP